MTLAEISEKHLKEQCLNWIKRHHPEIWLYKSTDLWVSGIPDILGCANGYFFAIELKTPKGTVTRLQRKTLDAIRKSGAKTGVIRNKADFIEFIQKLLDNSLASDTIGL